MPATYHSLTAIAFGSHMTAMVTYQTPPSHAQLAHGRRYYAEGDYWSYLLTD